MGRGAIGTGCVVMSMACVAHVAVMVGSARVHQVQGGGRLLWDRDLWQPSQRRLSQQSRRPPGRRARPRKGNSTGKWRRRQRSGLPSSRRHGRRRCPGCQRCLNGWDVGGDVGVRRGHGCRRSLDRAIPASARQAGHLHPLPGAVLIVRAAFLAAVAACTTGPVITLAGRRTGMAIRRRRFSW
jgi:hypothetical protein